MHLIMNLRQASRDCSGLLFVFPLIGAFTHILEKRRRGEHRPQKRNGTPLINDTSLLATLQR